MITLFFMKDMISMGIHSMFKYVINPSVWLNSNQPAQYQPAIHGNNAVDPKDTHLTQALELTSRNVALVEKLSDHLLRQSGPSGIEILPIANGSPTQGGERNYSTDVEIVGEIENIMHPDGVPAILRDEASAQDEPCETIDESETDKQSKEIPSIPESQTSRPEPHIEDVDEVDNIYSITEPSIRSSVT